MWLATGVAALLLAGCGAAPERSTATAASPGSRSDRASPAESIGAASPPGAALPTVGEPELDPARTIYFAPGRADLSPESKTTLRAIAEKLNGDKDLVLMMIGRTEDLGSKEYCVSLAAKRTAAVEDELLARGVRATQIRQRARGCETAADRRCDTETCRRRQRRVDLQLIETR